MFTGIVEEVGRIEAVTPLEGGRRLRIACSFAPELRVDESVAVQGVCLTVVACGAEAFEAVAVEETLSKTTLGRLEAGGGVNLERAVRLGGRLGGRLDGHLVQGHVDTTGTVASVEALADSHLVTVAYPPEHAGLVIPRGSICVDGISLTLARLDDSDRPMFTLAIIPHTWTHTTAAEWAPGQDVNLEFDLIGKYALRASATRASATRAS